MFIKFITNISLFFSSKSKYFLADSLWQIISLWQKIVSSFFGIIIQKNLIYEFFQIVTLHPLWLKFRKFFLMAFLKKYAERKLARKCSVMFHDLFEWIRKWEFIENYKFKVVIFDFFFFKEHPDFLFLFCLLVICVIKLCDRVIMAPPQSLATILKA